MIRSELHYFFGAVLFYTRIPCPAWVDHSPAILEKSRKYFPLIGWIIGGIGVGVLTVSLLVLPLSIALILSMAATVIATGAFHEDGFADSCDAFGGGWTKEQVLKIMKDSRLGTFGVIGLGLLMTLKFTILYEIGQESLPLLYGAYLNGHISSRFFASTVVQTDDYVQDLSNSKSKPVAMHRLSTGEMTFSFGFLVLGLLLLPPQPWLIIAFLMAYLARVYLASYSQGRIGGYTGDVLGATQQLCEVVLYLFLLILFR